jgi:hypothetical protein
VALAPPLLLVQIAPQAAVAPDSWEFRVPIWLDLFDHFLAREALVRWELSLSPAAPVGCASSSTFTSKANDVKITKYLIA